MRIPRARPSTVRGLLHLLALHCSAAPSPSPAPEAMAGTGESGGAPQARRDTGGDPQGWQGEPKAAAAVGSGPPVSTPTGAPEAHAAAPSTGSADGARGVPERGEGGESETGTSSAPAMRPGEERGAAGGWGGDRGAREQAEGTAAVVVEALGALRHLVEVSPQHSAEVRREQQGALPGAQELCFLPWGSPCTYSTVQCLCTVQCVHILGSVYVPLC